MNKILNNLFIVVFVSLTIFFAINAFFNIGLLADGVFTFSGVLQDLTWDDENRHFETFISHFALISSLFCGLKNINILVIIHGFWLYFSTLLLLFISYLLFPIKQKNLFLFTLLSYLIIMNISSGFITSQIFISVGLYWLIIIPIIFEDFNTISNKKLIIMILASFIMIKGYQLEIIFMIMFIILGFNILKKIKNYKKYYILTFIAVNIFALSYNICKYIFNLGNSYYGKKQYAFFEMINSNYFIQLIIFFILAFIVIYIIIKKSIIKSYNKLLVFLLSLIFIYLLLCNFIFCIYSFRILNYFISLLFSFVIYIIVKKNLVINIKYLKLFNIILLVTFIFNMSIVNIKWNKTIDNMLVYLTQNEGFVYLPRSFYNDNLCVFEHLNNLTSIIIQKQHGISHIKSVFVPIKNGFLSTKYSRIVLPDLKKYGIYYSNKFKFKYNNKFFSISDFDLIPIEATFKNTKEE